MFIILVSIKHNYFLTYWVGKDNDYLPSVTRSQQIVLCCLLPLFLPTKVTLLTVSDHSQYRQQRSYKISFNALVLLILYSCLYR